jgi:hypothetical protein
MTGDAMASESLLAEASRLEREASDMIKKARGLRTSEIMLRPICQNCKCRSGTTGTVKVLGCGGGYYDLPCPECRTGEYERFLREG